MAKARCNMEMTLKRQENRCASKNRKKIDKINFTNEVQWPGKRMLRNSASKRRAQQVYFAIALTDVSIAYIKSLQI